MPREVFERRSGNVLGTPKRAEQLVAWSLKHKAGQRWVKEFPFGLSLGFVANNSEPKMYVHWNQQKFWCYLDTLGEHEHFFVVSYGVCVEHDNGITRVRLLGAGRTGFTLWDSLRNPFSRAHSFRDPEDDVNWMVGMVKFQEDGIYLYRQVECQRELEESTALAVITGKSQQRKPSVTASQVLPKQEGLRREDRVFLIRDALTSMILKAQQTGNS